MAKTKNQYPRDYSLLSKRFTAAYKSIPRTLRSQFNEDFAAAHKVEIGTSEQKGYGFTDASEWECKWAEAYNPYSRKAEFDNESNHN